MSQEIRDPMFCIGCACNVAKPQADGETTMCACGWHYLRNEDGSISGRSPEAGPHPTEGAEVEPVDLPWEDSTR